MEVKSILLLVNDEGKIIFPPNNGFYSYERVETSDLNEVFTQIAERIDLAVLYFEDQKGTPMAYHPKKYVGITVEEDGTFIVRNSFSTDTNEVQTTDINEALSAAGRRIVEAKRQFETEKKERENET